MNRKRTALLTAVLLTLLALPVAADHAASGQNDLLASLAARPGLLVQALRLTHSQTDTLKTLITTLQNTIKPLATANHTLDQQIQTALGSPAPDNCAIGKLVVTRHQNELAIAAAFVKFDHDFSAILTPDQLARYQRIKNLLNHTGHDEDDG
jgi:Spy/CpxP family protein refolding chaperone